MIDESGAMLAPLVRRTLAPSGQTPVIEQRASRRDRVSLIAGLSLSAMRRQIGLHVCTLPRGFVNHERTAEFLRQLLRQLRGEVVAVWDRGNMHRGWAIRQVLERFPRLKVEWLPPYAPELNSVEFLWNHLKYGKLANYAPTDVPELSTRLRRLNVLLPHFGISQRARINQHPAATRRADGHCTSPLPADIRRSLRWTLAGCDHPI